VTNCVYPLLQGATLSALALALLAIQFSIVGSFVVLTWLVPLVFACAAARLPFRVIVMVVIGSVGGSLVTFGIVTAIWALFYALYGCVVGVAYRLHVPSALRILVGAFAFWALFQGIILLLILLVGTISMDSVAWMVDLFQQHYLFLAAPLVLIALINSLVIARLIERVFQRLSTAL